MMDAYREMLTYIKSAVPRSYSEKCINGVMNFISGSAGQNFNLLQEFYETTLQALEEAKNEILKELHKSCQQENGTDDQKKGTQLLKVYAIAIQMYTETMNNKKLKQLYQNALSVKSAISHLRIMGKMHIAERRWELASTVFFEAFKNCDEAENQRRIQCLNLAMFQRKMLDELLGKLILDNRVHGHIDRVNKLLIHEGRSREVKKYVAVEI